MGAENFNLVYSLTKMKISSSKFCIFGRIFWREETLLYRQANSKFGGLRRRHCQ